MFKRFVYVMLLLALSFNSEAQVLSAKVGVNGLTCSQCSRSVEMQLRKLAFVQNVNMDLEHTEGTLQFKEGSAVDFLEIAKAVKDAGFTVRFLEAKFDLLKVKKNEQGFIIANDLFVFPNVSAIKSNVGVFRFSGKTYGSKKRALKLLDAKLLGGVKQVYYLENGN